MHAVVVDCNNLDDLTVKHLVKLGYSEEEIKMKVNNKNEIVG